MEDIEIDRDKWLHRALPLYILVLLLRTPYALLPQNWYVRIGDDVMLVASLVALMGTLVHGQVSWCEYCVRNEPKNGPDAAHKMRRRLRLYHHSFSRWGFAYLAIIFFGPDMLPRFWPSFTAGAVLNVALLWWLWCLRTHTFLKTWCPWCRDDGDDLREPSPDPQIPKVMS